MTPIEPALTEIRHSDQMSRSSRGRRFEVEVDRTYLLARLDDLQMWLHGGTRCTATSVGS